MSEMMITRTRLVSGMDDRESEKNSFATLVEIGHALSGHSNLQTALQRTLEILQSQQGFVRSAVTLLDEGSGELSLAAVLNRDGDEQRVHYLSEMRTTGRVVDSSKPVVIRKLSGEGGFQHSVAPKKPSDAPELSFVCVPLVSNGKSIGALGGYVPFSKHRDYDVLLEFQRVVAAMIVQCCHHHRLVEAATHRMLDENINLREELGERFDFSNIIGNSGPMRQIYEQVAQVACTNTTILIRGESGTGKELIAEAIHHNSARAKKPLIIVNCAALPAELLEAELFGYERGAFTGAHGRKKGRFEQADGGTLFLDEIGDLNSSSQVKLLRVLQERQFERLGGTETIELNLRLITATNKDLEKAIAAGTFREDLYYRLNVFTIFIQPLRERRDDIMLLADHFLKRYSSEHGKQVRRISPRALDMLMGYEWPGNVRELANTIERAVLVSENGVIHSHHLPPALQISETSGEMSSSLVEAVEAYERDLIKDVLRTTRGNRSQAARFLKTTERVISYKVKKYDINCERFRD